MKKIIWILLFIAHLLFLVARKIPENQSPSPEIELGRPPLAGLSPCL